jgi:hypothetical protein
MPATGGIRAGRAFVELFVDDKRLVRGLRQAQRKLQAFGSAVRGLGLQFAALGAAVGAPLALATRHFIKAGDQLDKMAGRTGVSVEALSELGYAARLSGSSIEELESAVRIMQRTIGEAADGSTTATEALDRLGLSLADLQGMSPEQQFTAVSQALQSITDPTTRAAAAMRVFGRAGTKMLPLLNNLQDLRAEAKRLGITMSTQQSKAAAALGDAFDRVRMAVGAVSNAIGEALAPVLQELAGKLLGILAGLRAWFAENQGLVVSIAQITAIIAGVGLGLIALGGAVSLLAAAFGGLATAIAAVGAVLSAAGVVLGALLTPIGAVIAGVVVLGTVVLTTTQAGASALGWLAEAFGSLRDDAVNAWNGIAAALAAGNITLAAQVAWAGLKLAWTQGVAFLTEVWQAGVTGFAVLFAQGWYGIQEVFWTVVYALADAWDWVIGGITKLWNQTVGFIAGKLSYLLGLLGLVDEGVTLAIEEETTQRNRQVDDRRGQRRQGRQQDLVQQAEFRRQVVSGVEEDYGQGMMERQAEVDQARAAFDQLLQQARAARSDSETRRQAPTPAAPTVELPDLDRLAASLENLPETISAEAEKLDVTGSFSAAAIGQIGLGDTAADRTAKASEQTATNTTRMVRLLEEGGMEFG